MFNQEIEPGCKYYERNEVAVLLKKQWGQRIVKLEDKLRVDSEKSQNWNAKKEHLFLFKVLFLIVIVVLFKLCFLQNTKEKSTYTERQDRCHQYG